MIITFLITTYGRQESCQRLVDSLQGLGNIIVLNDGADYSITGCKEIRHHRNYGKRLYWLTVNDLFKARGVADYYFMLPDDFMPISGMIERALELYQAIDDPRKVCLNLIADRIGQRCWTGFKPVDRGRVYLTQWVDMCFLCEAKFFDLLGTLPRIDYNWFVKPNIGSGVGNVISRTLLRKGGNMYQAKESLVIMQEEHYNSVMHRKYEDSGDSYTKGEGK